MRAPLMFAVFCLASCGDSGDFEALEPPPRMLRPAGIEPPLIQSPRHRILSPVPRIHLEAPGHRGPAVVLLRTSRGQRFAWRTRERVLDWPRSLQPVDLGERGEVIAFIGRRAARASFERVAAPAPNLWVLDAHPAARLLDQNLPMEVLLGPFSSEPDRLRLAAALVGWPDPGPRPR